MATEPKLPEQLINQTQSHSYNTQKNRLTSHQTNGTTTSYIYDSEGQLKTQGATGYTFDPAHRLTAQGTSSYTYDGVGNRIKATRNGVTTKYIYDAAGNLLAEANASNVITRYYIYGNGLTALVDAATNALYVYHHDGTGHTVALTNAAQQTANTYAYDPYGRLMAQTEAVAQPFKYAGQVGVFAEGNNLYYMRARYYDANIGRFISEDPIGFAGGLNLYAYVGGNPVMFVDPSGLNGQAAMEWALSQVGSTAYNVRAINVGMGFPRFGVGIYKCNIFVNDALVSGGDPPPLTNGRPYLAGEWATQSIAGYVRVLGAPQNGDIVSVSLPGHDGYSGHTGIYAPLPNGNPGTVSVSSMNKQVVHNDWGFRAGDPPASLQRWSGDAASKK